MAQLRDVLARAGYKNVRTYIQSGNAVADTQFTAKEVENDIHDLIKEHIGADIVVVVRTGSQLQTVLDENPFKEGYDISRVFFLSFAETPSSQKVNEILDKDFGEEKLVITSKAAYMYIPGSSARSQISNNMMEKMLGVSSTTRNFNTMSKLIKMSSEQ